MVAEHQLPRMRIQVELAAHVVDFVGSDQETQERDRDDERDPPRAVVLDRPADLPLLDRADRLLQMAEEMFEDVDVTATVARRLNAATKPAR